MRWRWIIPIAVLVLLVIVPVVAVYRVLNSQAGLELALAQFQRLQNIRIEATGATGTLAGPLRVQRLVIEHEAVRIEAFDLRLQARMRELIASDTGQTPEKVEQDMNRDFWMSAQEARAYGVVDLVVGQTTATLAADQAEQQAVARPTELQ